MRRSFLGLLVFFIFQSASANKCKTVIDRELEALKMGAFSRPAECVNKQLDGKKGVAFTRGETKLFASDFFQGQRIIIESPSVVLSGLDSKEIILNGECEIESIQFCFSGDCSTMSGSDCEKINGRLKNASNRTGLENLYKELAGTKKWAKNSIMTQAVENFCLNTYKGQFRAPTSQPSSATQGSGGVR